MALGEVGTAIEGREVARQCQLAGRLHLVAKGSRSRAAPADQKVSDSADLACADDDSSGFDEYLAAAGSLAAVVCDIPGDNRDSTSETLSPGRNLRIDVRWAAGEVSCGS